MLESYFLRVAQLGFCANILQSAKSLTEKKRRLDIRTCTDTAPEFLSLDLLINVNVPSDVLTQLVPHLLVPQLGRLSSCTPDVGEELQDGHSLSNVIELTQVATFHDFINFICHAFSNSRYLTRFLKPQQLGLFNQLRTCKTSMWGAKEEGAKVSTSDLAAHGVVTT